MFVSSNMVADALVALQGVHAFYGFAYLAFKRAGLPVGTPAEINFSSVMNQHLNTHFRPLPGVSGYYSPFKSSRPAQRWLAERYGSTSLQRIVVDTFQRAFVHEKGTSSWCWVDNYTEVLYQLQEGVKIPAASLASWLYREIDLGDHATIDGMLERLVSDFRITKTEFAALFYIEDKFRRDFADLPMGTSVLEDLIGSPPGAVSTKGVALNELRIKGVGPINSISYSPGPRMNIITGDNSLGKSLLLDAIWWALTGSWAANSLLPPLHSGRESQLFAILSMRKEGDTKRKALFSWKNRSWLMDAAVPGASLVIYARHDGSALVWDPMISPDAVDDLVRLQLSADEIRNGKTNRDYRISLCNGLMYDWVSWQLNPSRHRERWEALEAALASLSPDDVVLRAGDPVKLPPNEMELPTIRMPYGDVLLSQASAATSRVLSLAYLLVWGWYRHVDAARSFDRPSASNIVIIVDELEAHLHPKWQRTVLPSLCTAIAKVSAANVQLHVATHSPLVLASIEPVFDEQLDTLFKFDYRDGEVELREMEFQKEGSVDRWLTSDVFGLGQSRSLVGERAIESAHLVMLSRTENREFAAEVHSKLLSALAGDDDFWPRWLPYAIKMGIVDAAGSAERAD